MASSRCWSWVSELTIAAPVPVAAMPDAARTLGGTPVDEMPAEAAAGGSEAAPPPPLAETVGVDGGVAPRAGRSRMRRGFPAAASRRSSAREWLVTRRSGRRRRGWRRGWLAAAGGGAEAGADAGVTLVAAGGGVGACGWTDGGSGLAAPEARPLVKPCDRSWPRWWASAGRPAWWGSTGMLGVLGMRSAWHGRGMDGIDGGFMPLAGHAGRRAHRRHDRGPDRQAPAELTGQCAGQVVQHPSVRGSAVSRQR